MTRNQIKAGLVITQFVLLIILAAELIYYRPKDEPVKPVPTWRPHNPETLFYWHEGSGNERYWKEEDELHDLKDSVDAAMQRWLSSTEPDRSGRLCKTCDSLFIAYDEAYKITRIP